MDPRQETVFQNARAGDPRAFRAFIEALAPDLVRFTTYLLHGDRDGAHDIVQDVFVRAWGALAGLRDADHARRWAFRVARCKAASYLRGPGRRWRRLVALPSDKDGGEALAGTALPPWETVQERPPAYAALKDALFRLPPSYGAAVQLHYLQGFALRETAHLLGVTLSTLKMRLVRARASLRHLLSRPLAPRDAPSAPLPRLRPGGPHVPRA